MPYKNFPAENAFLIKLLEQAGLDAQASAIAARIQGVLIDELHHRMKNMLTMVTAIVRQSMRTADSLETAERAISTRLMAMAKAHDLLLKADWKTAGLKAVIAGAIEQHGATHGRIIMDGGDIEIASAAIVPLTLLLNELCTNATKYGSLSKEGGRVRLAWTEDAGTRDVTFRWTETDGPAITAPVRSSFGTRLVEDALPRQLGGHGKLSFPAAGVEYVLNLPAKSLRAAA